MVVQVPRSMRQSVSDLASIPVATSQRVNDIARLVPLSDVARIGHTSGDGLVLGLIGSLAATRLLEGLLYGVAPRDPLTFAAVISVMGVVGLAACVVPALRAARVDPLVAIRKDR